MYSFGITEDWAWETAAHTMLPHCELHVFDKNASQGSLGALPPFVHFHALGLGTSDGFDSDCSGGINGAFPYDADAPNEDDFDVDNHVECTLAGISDVPGMSDLDCNDANGNIFPAALDDFTFPLEDNDCDLTFDEEGLSPGDLVITEIHANPQDLSDANGEWFELRNRTSNSVELQNWRLEDLGTQQFDLTESIVVPPNGFVVICRNPTQAASGTAF